MFNLTDKKIFTVLRLKFVFILTHTTCKCTIGFPYFKFSKKKIPHRP